VASPNREEGELLTERIPDGLALIWIENEGAILNIDGKKYRIEPNSVVCLTEFHQLKIEKFSGARLLRFNRPFYCILTHDDEVSCKGLLFFGASRVPIISLKADYRNSLKALWDVIENEFLFKDDLQLEMLRMLVKRFLILLTRAYKEQVKIDGLDRSQVDLIREFNFLVEKHFKAKHKVSEYAAMLHKSPKTLSNFFAKTGARTPLSYIQDRIILEARRKLHHSDASIKEIAYELGFEDLQSFSRFFKREEGIPPLKYRESR